MILGKIKDKLYDWKNRLKDRHMLSIIVVLIAIILILSILIYKKQRDYKQLTENAYNMSFFELVNYVQNVQTYLAKSLITGSSEQSAETLINVWREANLAGSYLSQLPLGANELENTSKFLNQVSEYCYSLSRKNIKGEDLTEEDLKNLDNLHEYSVNLENILNQLSKDINDDNIKWGELTKEGNILLKNQESNSSKDSFKNIEENFHKYSGLIYDGAFSEHITTVEKKGLTGDNINEEEALEKVKNFIGEEKIQEINLNDKSENGNIVSFNFNIKLKDQNNNISVSISEKGGHIVYMNSDREVSKEKISQEEADNKAKEFLNQNGFENMKETYYLKQNGIVTINYAYMQDEKVTIYPDLIKVKVALDNGEVLGIETTGYLNSHTKRNLEEVKITKEEAMKKLNKNLEIKSQNLAIIPTEWKTEILCWEFKGSIKGMDFLVYINANTGKEEDILLIVNTPNGTLTH